MYNRNNMTFRLEVTQRCMYKGQESDDTNIKILLRRCSFKSRGLFTDNFGKAESISYSHSTSTPKSVMTHTNSSKMKRRMLYLMTSRSVNNHYLGYKNQPVYVP